MSIALSCTTHVQAHFKQLNPASWLNEDSLGTPQKGSPCGPGNTRPFIGDDVQPIPVSDAVTTFHAGETITVDLEETVYHPGYFRISLAPVSAASATTKDFPDPPLTDTVNCHYDNAAVKTVPHDDVLADGLFMASAQNAENRRLTHEVKLPNQPCEHCTLQIVQVMEGHPASSCFYFHCAEIKIVAAEGAAGASAGTVTPAGSNESSGCSVAQVRSRNALTAAWCAIGFAAVLYRRRRLRVSRR